MANKIDVELLLSKTTASAVIGQFIDIKKKGAEFEACCPFHEEKTPSFKINDEKSFYYCFGCGASGDPLDFIQKIKGIGFKEAAEYIKGNKSIERIDTKKKPDKPKWSPLLPVPTEIKEPSNIKHYKYGSPSATWRYRDKHGNLLGLVCRFERAGGGKEICPYVFAANCTSRQWRWLSFPKPRPLYGLEKLSSTTKTVIVVEGEKAADAAQSLLPSIPVLSWPGGGKAVKYANWKILKGLKVVIWPDRDKPGLSTAFDIADHIKNIAVGTRILQLPPGPDDGFDAADFVAHGETSATTGEWLKENLKTVEEYRELTLPWDEKLESRSTEQPEDDPYYPEYHDKPEEYYYSDAIDEQNTENNQFTCLGYNHGEYFYYSKNNKQVTSLSCAAHTKNSLLSLAPLQYWEREYPSKNGPRWDSAIDGLMRQSEKAGVYDPSRVRGRGAWWDNNSSVLHLGDRLVVGNEFKQLGHSGTKYIYEAATPFPVNLDNPLVSRDAVRLIDFCKMLPWEKPINAMLLAGWCVIAPICGALNWRPHIWITGAAGTGKSWIFDHVLKRCLGDIALQVQSETTEAGLRQALGQDARPVIFDEAEGEDQRAQARIQNVMALMRQSSSESGASILKGTAGGSSRHYKVRSCFAFESIGVGLQQHADKTRVTILSLLADSSMTPEQRAQQFDDIQNKWYETLTEDFIHQLHARVIRLIPQIRKNAETFAVAGAKTIGTRRLGDQIGALLAGAYALYSSNEISMQDATEWLSKQDWSEESAIQNQNDEQNCIKQILETTIKVYGDKHRIYDHTISELIQIVDNTYDPYATQVEKQVAEETLRRHGIRVEFQRFIVSNNHSFIASIMRNTSWAKDWSRTLRRIPGAKTSEPMRFGSGIQSRGISLSTDIAISD